jgi:hypothetical protein
MSCTPKPLRGPSVYIDYLHDMAYMRLEENAPASTNLYDDYLSIFANTDEALNQKLKEMEIEGWTPYGELIRMELPTGLYLEQPIVKRNPFPGSYTEPT